MKIINIFIFAFVLVFTAASCSRDNHHDEHENHQQETGDDHQHEHEGEHEDEHEHEREGEHEEGEIHLTQEQIKTVDVAWGEISTIKINDYISATGTLGLPPQSYATVSAKATGFIKNSNRYVEGSYVKKGAVIAYLENPEFIKQQQAYLEVSAELTYLQQELARQQQLVAADAGILKNVQKLQSEVSIKTARMKGIAKQLAYLGIDVAVLSPGNIRDRIPIMAPMSGFLTSIDVHNGMYVTPEKQLMEIVSEDHLHLELDIFEKDIARLKEEQKISYTIPAYGNTVYTGEVHIIGKEFNSANKTVRVHGHLTGKRPKFIKDLFVDAKIWLNDQTVQAVPDKAIIREGADAYIYITDSKAKGDEIIFEKAMVIPGTSDKGYTAIKLLNPLPGSKMVVTKGAYYVYAQSKAGELQHEH